MDYIEKVKNILEENTKVVYGIFGVIYDSGYFPPRKILNEFLIKGYDPCDQDRRMEKWNPLELNETEYEEIKKWWFNKYENTIEYNFGKNSWNEWIEEILELGYLNLSREKAIIIAEKYKEEYPKIFENIEFVNIQYNPRFDVKGEKAWIVEFNYKQFNENWEIWFVISDLTESVEYVFNHHGGRIIPHLDKKIKNSS